MSDGVSPERRADILGALRRGTVPERALEAFAVGLDRFVPTFDEELARVRAGAAGFKAVRGEYGSGKTFFSRFLADRARRQGFATAEVQISEAETPLYKLETVYRRLVERLTTAEVPAPALPSVIDGWLYTLEEDVLAEGGTGEAGEEALLARSTERLEQRLAAVSRVAPAFAAAVRAYRLASARGDHATAQGLLAWISGQPNVAAAVKRAAGVKGEVDHFAALHFLLGLLTILRDSGYSGLVLVLDELETLQRVRSDAREKALNALRQSIDELDGGRFPGLYLVITGTPAFFDGPLGVRRLPPLAQRLEVDFGTDERFDNPRAPQIRLPAFHHQTLVDVGRRIRDLYAAGATAPERLRERADDTFLAELARAVAGQLGGRIGVAPRLFLKKLVADVLDRIDQFPDFDPRSHYAPTVREAELSAAERAARGATSPDDVELEG